jgi:hypothetical protein
MYLGIEARDPLLSVILLEGGRGVDPAEAAVLADPESQTACTFPVIKMGPRDNASLLIGSTSSSEDERLSESQ